MKIQPVTTSVQTSSRDCFSITDKPRYTRNSTPNEMKSIFMPAAKKPSDAGVFDAEVTRTCGAFSRAGSTNAVASRSMRREAAPAPAKENAPQTSSRAANCDKGILQFGNDVCESAGDFLYSQRRGVEHGGRILMGLLGTASIGAASAVAGGKLAEYVIAPAVIAGLEYSGNPLSPGEAQRAHQIGIMGSTLSYGLLGAAGALYANGGLQGLGQRIGEVVDDLPALPEVVPFIL